MRSFWSIFQSLYMLEGCKQGSCLNAIGQVITTVDNETLMAPYSELEITNALFSMHPHKSLGPDGVELPSSKSIGTLLVKG